MRNILIVGQCGSGKTWVMKQLIDKLDLNITGKVGMFYFHRNEKVLLLGKYDGSTFEGSDRLSMAVVGDMDKFRIYVAAFPRVVIAEGDRFTNSTYIQAMQPTIIRINDDGSAGRKKRGSTQTERQIKSIATRVSKVKPQHEVKDSSEALKLIVKLLKP